MDVLVASSHPTDLLVYLYRLYQGRQLCDLILTSTDNVEFLTHRIVMSAASEYLHQLFTSHSPVASNIRLDLPSDVLHILIEFIYTGQLLVTEQIRISLRHAASFLQIRTLEKLLHPVAPVASFSSDNILPNTATGTSQTSDWSNSVSSDTIPHSLSQSTIPTFVTEESSGLVPLSASIYVNATKNLRSPLGTGSKNYAQNNGAEDKLTQEKLSKAVNQGERTVSNDCDIRGKSAVTSPDKRTSRGVLNFNQADFNEMTFDQTEYSGLDSLIEAGEIKREVAMLEEIMTEKSVNQISKASVLAVGIGSTTKNIDKTNVLKSLGANVKQEKLGSKDVQNVAQKQKVFVPNIPGKCQCSVCGKTFSSFVSKRMHSISNHRHLICEYSVGTYFKRRYKMLCRHIKNCDFLEKDQGHGQYSCVMCGAAFKYYSLFKRHVTTKHSRIVQSHHSLFISVIQTGRNQRWQKSQARLKMTRTKVQNKVKENVSERPKNIPTNSKKVTCSQCKKSYCSIHYLRRHLLQTHGVSQDEAEKVGSRVKSIKVSSAEFQCVRCLRCMVDLQTLVRHLQDIHKLKGEEARKCASDVVEELSCTVAKCRFISRNLQEMDAHMQTSHPQKQLSCLQCSKLFRVKQLLERHVASKHRQRSGKKKPTCTVCKKTYLKPYYLRIHEYWKHGIPHPQIKIRRNRRQIGSLASMIGSRPVDVNKSEGRETAWIMADSLAASTKECDAGIQCQNVATERTGDHSESTDKMVTRKLKLSTQSNAERDLESPADQECVEQDNLKHCEGSESENSKKVHVLIDKQNCKDTKVTKSEKLCQNQSSPIDSKVESSRSGSSLTKAEQKTNQSYVSRAETKPRSSSESSYTEIDHKCSFSQNDSRGFETFAKSLTCSSFREKVANSSAASRKKQSNPYNHRISHHSNRPLTGGIGSPKNVLSPGSLGSPSNMSPGIVGSPSNILSPDSGASPSNVLSPGSHSSPSNILSVMSHTSPSHIASPRSPFSPSNRVSETFQSAQQRLNEITPRQLKNYPNLGPSPVRYSQHVKTESHSQPMSGTSTNSLPDSKILGKESVRGPGHSDHMSESSTVKVTQDPGITSPAMYTSLFPPLFPSMHHQLSGAGWGMLPPFMTPANFNSLHQWQANRVEHLQPLISETQKVKQRSGDTVNRLSKDMSKPSRSNTPVSVSKQEPVNDITSPVPRTSIANMAAKGDNPNSPKTEKKEVKQEQSSLKNDTTKTKASRTNYTCDVDVCEEKFASKFDYDEHKLKVHDLQSKGKGEHLCKLCHETFDSKDTLLQHEMKIHQPVCEYCGESFQSWGTLFKHKNRMHIEERQCQICQKVFEAKTLLNRHMKIHGTIKEYQCDFEGCQYKTISRSGLKLHANKHNKEKRFMCTVCGLKLKTALSQKKHMDKMHLGIRPYLCQMCAQSFGEEHELHYHIKHRHATELEYRCQYCPYATANKSTFYTHVFNVHKVRVEGDKRSQFKCPHCNYTTVLHHRYKTHLNGHTNTREYTCHICQKSFVSASTLRSHQQWYHSAEVFSCTHCEYQTKTKQKLNEHIRVQHQLKGLKPYKCPYCEFSCATGGNCRKHVRQVHRGEVVTYIRNDLLIDAAREARKVGQTAPLASSILCEGFPFLMDNT